jgi:hypothetical protein
VKIKNGVKLKIDNQKTIVNLMKSNYLVKMYHETQGLSDFSIAAIMGSDKKQSESKKHYFLCARSRAKDITDNFAKNLFFIQIQ